MSDAKPRRKVTFKTLQKKMAAGEPITQLAAYDYRTAVIADRLGMDILCVSDTGGMILFGHQSTCLLYTSPSPRDISGSRMPSSA